MRCQHRSGIHLLDTRLLQIMDRLADVSPWPTKGSIPNSARMSHPSAVCPAGKRTVSHQPPQLRPFPV